MDLIRDHPTTSFGVALFFAIVFFSPVGAVAAVIIFILAVQVYRRKRDARALELLEARIQENRRAWRDMKFAPGCYSVVLSGFVDADSQDETVAFLADIPGLRDRTVEIEELIERVNHISPEAVAEGIAQRDAVRLKQTLERRGAKVKIIEAVVRRSSSGREMAGGVSIVDHASAWSTTTSSR
jgi:muconolactone delta-isomerase